MNSVTTTMNLLGSKGKKVIVEFGGHVFSVPLQDVQDMPLSDRHTYKAYHPVEGPTVDNPKAKTDGAYDFQADAKQVSSDSFSEMSMSDLEFPPPKSDVPKTFVSSSASQVLCKLKDEVTRLIDESILKIEQDWAEKAIVISEVPEEESVPLPAEKTVVLVDDAQACLHPDGDRGQHSYREQNLQVLHTKSFVKSKGNARTKLLDEIHVLVDRLKDMETLE